MAYILLVDDEPDTLGALSRVLGRLGHDVMEAGSGREALRLLVDGAFDLVVTDINMPDLDGIELILAVREQRPDLPVIAVSGGGLMPPELLLANAGVLGACLTLQKPMSAASLAEAVGRALPSGVGTGADEEGAS